MRRIKKLTSVLLAVLLATSVSAVAFESVSALVDENGCYVPGDNVKCGTYRYYFAMPNSWLNEYTDTAGVYWWSGTDACGAVDGSGGTVTWPGYKAQKNDYKSDTCGIYYVDCPTDVTAIIWNNYINGGTDNGNPIFSCARQANDAYVEFYSDGDSDIYVTEWFEEMEEYYNGDKSALGDYADNFFYEEEYGLGFSFELNNMIYVIDSSMTSENFMGKLVSVGDWYFYYGNGEYGIYPTKEWAVAKGDLRNLADFVDIPFTPGESAPVYPTNPVPTTPDDPVYPDADEGKIHFDVKKSGWNLNTNKKFYCHIWKCDGSPTSSGTDWLMWQSKQELCDFDPDTGIASFDLTKTGHNFDASDGKLYCVIFSSNTGMQTYNTIMSGSCIGDTMYCSGEHIENPEDSERRCDVAVWENNPDCGPEKKITSTGNVVGSAYPEGETDETLLAKYLLAYYDDPAKTEITQNLINKLVVAPADVFDEVVNRCNDSKAIQAIANILMECSNPKENIIGDVDGNGVLSVADATLIQKHSADLVEFTESQIKIADVNGDGAINVLDATAIQQLLVV